MPPSVVNVNLKHQSLIHHGLPQYGYVADAADNGFVLQANSPVSVNGNSTRRVCFELLLILYFDYCILISTLVGCGTFLYCLLPQTYISELY